MVAVSRNTAGRGHERAVTTCRVLAPRLLTVLIVLVALLALTVVDAPAASLRIFWRFAVLSFDSPATQAFDELACESSTSSGVATDTRHGTRLVPVACVVPVAGPTRLVSPALSSCITRSPPSA
jgi:hypothetical protein